MDQDFGLIEPPTPPLPVPTSTPPLPPSLSQPPPQFTQAGRPKRNYRLPARYEDITSQLEDFQSDSRTSRILPAFAPPDRSSTTTFAMHRLGDLCSTHRIKRPLYCQNSMDFMQSAKLKLCGTDAFSRYMISSSTYIACYLLSNFFR